MTIIKNSAKCTACGVEIESKFGHDFNVHYCKVAPEPGKKWENGKLVPSGEETYRFGVDGGKWYIRRIGEGFTDTSVFEQEEAA